MTYTHNEEADNSIVKQLIHILKKAPHGVSIISDYTDDCDLLAMYHFICDCVRDNNGHLTHWLSGQLGVLSTGYVVNLRSMKFKTCIKFDHVAYLKTFSSLFEFYETQFLIEHVLIQEKKTYAVGAHCGGDSNEIVIDL